LQQHALLELSAGLSAALAAGQRSADGEGGALNALLLLSNLWFGRAQQRTSADASKGQHMRKQHKTLKRRSAL
jgi:hypothetical protein